MAAMQQSGLRPRLAAAARRAHGGRVGTALGVALCPRLDCRAACNPGEPCGARCRPANSFGAQVPISFPSFMAGTVSELYAAHVAAGEIERDPAQEAIAARLARLNARLAQHRLA